MFEDAGHGGHIEVLEEMGGTKKVLAKLNTDPEQGLSDSQVEASRSTYGENRLPERRQRAFYEFLMDALEDRVLMILIFAAIVSLVLGVAFEDPETGWIEGFAILVAVALVSLVAAGNDFTKDRKFRKLESVKDDRRVKVVRKGKSVEVSTYDLVVGDICLLSTGDWVPADLLVIDSHSVEVDEASMTGEPMAIKKNPEKAPFCFSGTQVMTGEAKCCVLAVGVESQWGILQMSLRGKMKEPVDEDGNPLKWPNNKRWLCCPLYAEEESSQTPLQKKLGDLADKVGYAGLIMAILTFLVLLIKWGIGVGAGTVEVNSVGDVAPEILHFFLTAITIVVVAVPEGLPLAVTIALAYSQRKMMKDNNLVRVLAACETMGGATQITTDKTGTLTENRMTVVAGFISKKQHEDVASIERSVKDEQRELLNKGIALNSTAFITRVEGEKTSFVGSKTECALLMLSEDLGASYSELRSQHKNQITHLYPFSSKKKSMGVVVANNGASSKASKKSKKKSKEPVAGASGYTFFLKGASEVVLAMCDRTVAKGGAIEKLTDADRVEANDRIKEMASRGLRTLCLAYMEIPNELDWENEQPDSGLICQAIVGIKDPVRKEVPHAVKQCQKAGVKVRMVTGDNILTASHIAEECGIKTENGIAMTGPEFRKLSNSQLDPMLKKGGRPLDVIARCSPLDKQRLVGRLKFHGEVVASTGDGTNDAPQLKLADVGFAMGIAGTEVAKEACDIILMDDNFSSVVKALMWGRNVYDSIRKFLQFQLTVNVAALVVAFLGALIGNESPLTAVQLLWVNLIMDTMAALALATEQPTPALLNRKPYGRFDALITTKMWRFILGHALYQIVVLMSLLFVQDQVWFFRQVDPGRPNFDAEGALPWCNEPGSCTDSDEPRQDTTVIFNTFVFMQVFNEFNARFLEDEKNLFAGLHTNYIFWAVIFITVILQVPLVEYGGAFTQTAHLSSEMWLGCLVFSVAVLPYGILLRFVPVPETCCIKSLAGGRPENYGEEDYDDEDGIDLAEVGHVVESDAVGLTSGAKKSSKKAKLQAGSHWHKAQDVATQVSVVNAFRRSGRR